MFTCVSARILRVSQYSYMAVLELEVMEVVVRAELFNCGFEGT